MSDPQPTPQTADAATEDGNNNKEGPQQQQPEVVQKEETPVEQVPVEVVEQEVVKEDWQVQRDHHKQQGDAAFRCGAFKTAIGEYTNAISLDPDFVVAYSNRSAAYLKNSEKSKALKDAQHLVQTLDPKYAKGHSRLAAALHSLKRYEQALDSYQNVLKLDPNNAAAKKGVQDCQVEITKHLQFHQEQKEVEEEEEKEKERKSHAAALKEKEEEEEQQQHEEKEDNADDGDDDDDLLNDFFADVDEVVTSKKKAAAAPVIPEAAKATNKVKHDKQTLGSSAEQLERLLGAPDSTAFEWRNLNPFYVLQLPHTATEEDISRRYKALSLMLHPDKNGGSERAQQAFDHVKQAKTILTEPDRAKHTRMLVEEGMKQGLAIWKKAKSDKTNNNTSSTSTSLQEKEVMRIFAHVEQSRRQVEQRERQFQQREQKQEDDALEKEKQARKFDKSWRQEERVDKRVGNWRDFATTGSSTSGSSKPKQKKAKKG